MTTITFSKTNIFQRKFFSNYREVSLDLKWCRSCLKQKFFSVRKAIYRPLLLLGITAEGTSPINLVTSGKPVSRQRVIKNEYLEAHLIYNIVCCSILLTPNICSNKIVGRFDWLEEHEDIAVRINLRFYRTTICIHITLQRFL